MVLLNVGGGRFQLPLLWQLYIYIEIILPRNIRIARRLEWPKHLPPFYRPDWYYGLVVRVLRWKSLYLHG
jgi:hypothetical protein